ncbi:MAG: hypothetical protein Q9219_003940 [cf. Caloplaca sp. 3 TL-2023]
MEHLHIPEQPDQQGITCIRSQPFQNEAKTSSLRSGRPPPTKDSSKKPKPPSAKKSFPFLSLPPELRVKIYHLALTFDRILIRKARVRRTAGLILANRLIYSEAFPIFYEANAFQVHIGGLPTDTETPLANVHHMKQCCLEFEVAPKAKSGVLRRLIDKFVDDIWGGKMECLLIDAWEYPGLGSFADHWLSKFSWVRRIHLVQVVFNQVGKKGKVNQHQDQWCQRLERSMMARQSWIEYDLNLIDEYGAAPKLGIDLVGEELEDAKRNGGWVIGEDDLYVLFGKV